MKSGTRSGDSYKAAVSQSRIQGSGWFNDRVNASLPNQSVASRPFNPHPYLPEITRQVLLDTSDSESEKCEPPTNKLGDGPDPEFSGIPEHQRISPFEPGRSSRSFLLTGSESGRPVSDWHSEYSNSKFPEPENNLRFVPSPHPDMIRRVSSGSGSLKVSSGAASSTSWKNPRSSQCLVPQKRNTNHCEKINSGSTDSSGTFVPLPKSRFTFKTAYCATGNTDKSSSESMAGIVKKVVPHRWTSVPSGTTMDSVALDWGISGAFCDDAGPPSSAMLCTNVGVVRSRQNLGSHRVSQGSQLSPEPDVSQHDEVPTRGEFESQDTRKLPLMEPTSTVNMNNVQPASNTRQETVRPAAATKSELVLGERNVRFIGRHSDSSEGLSFQSSQEPIVTYLNVVGSGHNQGDQVFGPIKLEPPEYDPRTVGIPPDRLSMSQNLPSSQASGSCLDLLNFRHPLNNQQPKPQISCVEQVVSDPIVLSASGTSASPRSLPSSSHYLTSRQASSFVGFGHSSSRHVGIDDGSRNNDSSRSKSFAVPSNHSYMDTNSGSVEYSTNQGCQVTSDSSDSGAVVMSVVHKKNKIAGSSYNLSTGQVYLLESVSENFEFCTTVMALRSVSPSIVVVPSSGATRFVKEFKAKIEGDQTIKDCRFQCISPRYFAYSFARQTVLESSLWERCLTFRSEDAKKNAIVSNINLNDERLVCAFGGLLYYISTSCPQLGAGLSPSPINLVQHMKLSQKLWLDTESFRNLQIFDPAEHPSSFKWSSPSRDDGKSIFGLFERFCSSVGMTMLKSFLANPVNCRRTLEKRHEVIYFYLNPSNYNAVEALRSFASQMSSSSLIMSYLSSPTLRGGHWKHIYRHIYYTVSYAEVCRNNGNQSELFQELGSTIVDAVYSMAHNLERVVDLVNMENNETFVIKYGFHPPLDAAKEKFSRLKMAMDKVTPYEFDSVPSFITKVQMMYIPEMKFLLSIPYWAPDLSKEELNLPNLEFKFTANKTAFYKSRRCYELDELLGDAQTDIINEESMIIQSLRNYLKKHMHHIVEMAQKIAGIECIFALAKVAREERYTKPEISDGCVIDIRGGWHPLLDVPSNEVITNDTVSSADASLVKLIHGPNNSGKSIYLKQVGLILYLAHIGSYVPAVSAKVGLFSRILARTTIEESVISMSSTMLSELKKLQDAVMGSTSDSLVIMDEVGKGSTEVNCLAIVTSAVNYFLSQGTECPHVLISTHISGISDFVKSPPHSDDGRNLFELLVMDYAITEGEIVFLYKTRRGSPTGCSVFEVLENSEFAAPIVKTARTVLEALRTGEQFLPYCDIRIQRSHKYLNFIRKFVNIDMSKQGYLEKLQNKIQRYYEKPSY